ncbi:MAG: hypothetical protein KAZ87_00145 [Spirochaetes bacterium]|nr:hypothetical protein [Spirochaetota bacterium]
MLRLRLSGAVSILFFLALIPSILSAMPKKIAVLHILAENNDSALYADMAYNAMNELVKKEGFDSSVAIAESRLKKLSYYEMIDLLSRAGAETVFSGEIRKTENEVIFRFFAFDLKNDHAGKIYARYEASADLTGVSPYSINMVCREHVIRFLDRYSKERSFSKLPDYYKEKETAVLAESSFSNSSRIILFSPLISAFSPIYVPYEYASSKNYKGLSLYLINSAPYQAATYITAWRMLSPFGKRDRKASSSEKIFMYYNLALGGLPHYLALASDTSLLRMKNYGSRDELIGNRYCEAFFMLTGNGSAHFYKGHHAWGYFYYHTDMILAAAAISAMKGERFFFIDSFEKKDKAKLFFALAGVRVVEAVHAYFSDYDILNGSETSSPLPYLFMNEDTLEGGMSIRF